MNEVKHDFSPVYNSNSRILILGSIPSAASRQRGFYYMHPRNRFWKLMEQLLDWPTTETIEQKKQMLLANKIALWDVLESCEIQGSSDSSIQNPKANNFTPIFKMAHIKTVFTNGRKAYELYNKYSEFSAQYPAIYLPSTSPANASYSMDKLYAQWQVILEV